MRHPTQEFFAAGLLDAAVPSLAGCGSVDQAVSDGVKILEAQFATVEGELQPEVAREVRDDYTEIATSANCPGYDAED
jgi:hypothetical protein